jgi:hypothetical protein
MSVNLELCFGLEEKVRMAKLDLVGIVVGIWIAHAGAKFTVRYFWNGEAKEVYFYAHELEAI